MNFQVPQFIQIEDRIIGGVFTLKQFLVLAACGALSFLLFFIFDFFLWLFLTLILAAIAVGLTFVKINGRPLGIIALAAFRYYWNPRFYIWQPEKREIKIPELESERRAKPSELFSPEAIREKLLGSDNLQNLWEKITTSRVALPKRETSLHVFRQKSENRKELLRKASGELIEARRVDYK